MGDHADYEAELAEQIEGQNVVLAEVEKAMESDPSEELTQAHFDLLSFQCRVPGRSGLPVSLVVLHGMMHTCR